MGGIFGCFGSKCSNISSVLEETLDKSRGDVVHMIEVPGYIMGAQVHEFESDENCYNSNKLVITFLSDSAKLDFQSIESFYLSNGFKGLSYSLLHTINADFALALFDIDKKKAFLMCDPTGIRKIFYTLVNGNLVYSSSLKHIIHFLEKCGVLKDIAGSISIHALRVYLAYGVTPINLTLIKGVYKLQMNQAILFDVNESKLSEITISVPIQNFVENTEEGLIKRTYELLQTSIKERIENYNGILLSGGIDSSLIASILANLCPSCQNIAVNVCYGSYSELKNAHRVAEYLGINLIEAKIPLESSKIYGLLNESISFFDEPNARGNFIGRYYALRELHKYTNTAFLGEGGDELFLGYWPSYWFWYHHPAVALASHPLIRVLNKIINSYINRKHLSLKHINRIIDMIESSENASLALMTWFTKTNPSILKPIFTCSSPYDFIDKKMFLRVSSIPDTISRTSLFLFMLLTQSDVAVDENICSRLGLKLKLPYLDPRIVWFAFSVNPRHKLKGRITKYLLRKVIEYYRLLPVEITQQEKRGFTSSALLNEEFLIQQLRDFYSSINNNAILKNIIYHASKSSDLPLITSTLVLCKWYEGMRGES
jgi:asparagine synthase (glutamine-hydrolysing)